MTGLVVLVTEGRCRACGAPARVAYGLLRYCFDCDASRPLDPKEAA